MSPDPRRELAELVQAARAHLEWLADSGVEDVVGRMPATIAAARRPPAAGPPSVIGPAAEPRAPFEAPGAREPSTIADLIQVNPRVAASHARSTGVAASGSPRIALSGTERRRQLEVLAAEVAACTACPLHQTRNRTAFARGNPDAELVFVGEGPGTQEDLQGEPFVGPAGQLLDKMIAAMGYERDDVYIMNVVKCRPFEHGNPQKDRKPEPDELAACRPFFDRQLELLEPKVMVALGATAVQALTGASAGITRLRGTWRLYRGRIPLMPTFHPAYLLRSPEKKRDVWDDLQQVMQRLGREAPKKGR